MKAKIIDIEDSNVTVKTENEKFVTIPRERLKFDYYINQNVTIERDNNKVYILPDTLSSFWGNDATKVQKNNKNLKRKIIGLTIAVVGCAVLIIPLVSIAINSKEEERKRALASCLSNAGTSYSEEHINNRIECYKEYGGSDAEGKIAENENDLKRVKADQCAQEAEENYAISDEEWEEANTSNDANYIIMINTRLKNKAETQIACYKNVEGVDTSSLSATIKDIESKNATLENIIEQQNNKSYSSGSSSSVHCSTRTVGSSAYTDCY